MNHNTWGQSTYLGFLGLPFPPGIYDYSPAAANDELRNYDRYRANTAKPSIFPLVLGRDIKLEGVDGKRKCTLCFAEWRGWSKGW